MAARCLRLCLAILLPLLCAPAATADEVYRIGAEDDWYPFTALREGKVQGMSADLVRAAFAASNTRVELVPYPYSRCMELTRTGQLAACFNTSPDADIASAFRLPQEPLFSDDILLWARRDDAHPIANLQQLTGQKVAVTIGYTYGEVEVENRERGTDSQRFAMAADAVFDTAGIVNGRPGEIVCRVQLLAAQGAPAGTLDQGPAGPGDLRLDDRSAVAGVHLHQPRTVEHPGHRFDLEAGGLQEFAQFCGVEFAGVERVDRGVAARGEGDPVGRGHQQHPARAQHPPAFGDEVWLIPQMLDDLEVHHDVHRGVGQRQGRQIALRHRHPGVARTHVGDRRGVVVEGLYPARRTRQQIGPVALAASGLEYVATCAHVRTVAVDHLVAAEPVVLHRHAGDGALTGQR